MESNRIDIVLATYNGQNFLMELLTSIVNSESYTDLINKVIITDDNSTDDTKLIVESFKNDKFEFYLNEGSKGPVGNFESGIKYSNASFIMFADQDDIWMSDKIMKFHTKAIKLNSKVPGAVYSDLSVVDEKLVIINKSFFDNESIDFNWGTNLSNLLLQNSSPGCALLVNKATITRSLPFHNIMMHDWWLLMYSALYSNVIVINEQLVKYRQHSNNAVGATKSFSIISTFNKLKKTNKNFKLTIKQITQFNEHLRDEELKLLDRNTSFKMNFLCELSKQSFIKRVRFLLKPNKLKSSFIRSFITMILLLIY